MRQLTDYAIKADAIKLVRLKYAHLPVGQRLLLENAFLAGYKLARDHAVEASHKKATTSEALGL